MKKRILAVFLAAAALTCSLSACGGATTQTTAPSDETTPSSGEPHGNEITVGIAQDLESSLDPYQMTAAGTREVMFNVFEGLVKPDSSGNYVNAVASDVSISEDGLTYTFTLRDGVVFHNGETCTTEDVLYSFETCAATSWTSAVVEALSAVTDLRAEGNQVIVTLNAPNPDFLSYVSSVSIVPAGYDQQATQPVGTGPFKFVSRSVQENIILERHEDYYGTPAYLDRVTYRIYEDSNALFTALNSGALDLVAHLTSDQVSNLTNGYEVLEGTMNLVQALYLNHAVEPFNDVRVRQALCYAVDVDAMLALTAGGHGTKVGSSMYPAFTKYFDASLADAYPHDVEKAKALLAEAGYPDGFSFTITVPSNYQPHVDTAEVLVEQLSQVGITAQIDLVDWNTWLEDVYGNRNFETTVVGFDSSILNASGMLARWVTGSDQNMINYSDPDYDAAYAAAQATVDDAEQTAYYKECLQILSDTAANVYLQDLADFVAINPALEGFQFYPLYVIDMSLLRFAD
ncbi:MAG TPA: ABC transporter substrate-binding protein [Candidatus Intestinimonas pullistercoris]|mgnify:FL=1|uniref:ABC transporter substrate-binding protein n=1 Tax=Candidatus Intestinimonas pullistercoris TaxID=2838623 RepID=A0A9D2T079_9FIRM|nr:ABC transporter substrate-binding protein [uncultured Intestinimonas sp.]HJC40606.1 ABC transporter substrate-binding protein [Candidatus Intestinimonas pullistercoris]